MWKVLTTLLGLGFSLTVQATSGTLLRDENLRQDTGSDARVLALLSRGDAVDIQARQGGWLRVSTGQGEGWVRLLSVRGDVAAQTAPLAELRGELSPASRRLESRIVAVAGFRGGEEEAKIEAAAEAALDKLEAYRQTASAATTLAARRGLLASSATCGPAMIEAEEGALGGATSGARMSLMSAWLLNRMDAEHEARIGRALAVRLLIAMPAVADAGAQDYLNRIGRWVVAAQGGRADARWLFALLDSDEIHAWSTPGGHVFITRGLYQRLRDEAELAAVLAGEVARLADKRLLRDLRANAAGSGRPRDEAAFLRQLLGDGLEALQRPETAECEYQADRAAVLQSSRAGYDPYALAAFLQQLGTLPDAAARLARLSNTLEDCLAGLPAGKTPPLYRMNN